MNPKVVYIFNMSEDVWPFITTISDPKARQFEIDEASHLADRDLFLNSNERSFVFVTPEHLDKDFLEYFKNLTGIRDIEILVPNKNSGRITDDILNDSKLFKRILQIGKEFKQLVLKSYSSTYGLYRLIRELRKQKVDVIAPESPSEENAWTVNYFGSKTGIRQLVNKINRKDIVMADGIICSGIEDASEFATYWYLKNKGVVIKTHKGHAGMGVLLFKYGSLPKNYSECKVRILQILQKDEYWEQFPIIIESYVDFDETVSGGFPNIEYKILPDGTVTVLYPCGMRVSDKGVFIGVEINEKIYDKNLSNKLVKIGNKIGNEYSKAGYRGNFEFDFALGKNGELYITESNVRKTGGTFVYEAAKKLIGENFLHDSYVLSTNIYKLPKGKKYSFKSLRDKLSPHLLSPKTKEGIVLTSANLLTQGSFGYIIFGKDKDRALNIEKKMQSLLRN